MLMNNRFSKKNSLLYKMKCINTRDKEYYDIESNEYDREERYTDKYKK